jgi:hypothetical protein
MAVGKVQQELFISNRGLERDEKPWEAEGES